MHPVNQLDQLRRQLLDDLMKNPQYRALKAVEKFIGEMSAIYDLPPQEDIDSDAAQRKIAQAIEKHVRGDAGPAVVKNASYIPVHRVA